MDTLANEYRRDAAPTLLSLVEQRNWPAARQYALEAAAVAEARNDVGDMLRAGDDLERFNEFAIAGRLLAKGGRVVARAVGVEWDGTDLPGKTLLIEQRIRHVGNLIATARLAVLATKHVGRCIVLTDPRLVPLFTRSFPGLDVRAKGIEDEKLRREADVVASFETLMQHLVPDAATLAASFSPLRADASLVRRFRERYRRRGSRVPVIGIAWASDNEGKDLPPLESWAHFLREVPARFISLQYGDVAGDVASFRALGPAPWSDPEVDSLRDLDTYAAQVASLDAVVAISNTAVHMAGGLGIPTIVVLDDRFHLIWPVGENRTPWYPDLVLVRKQGRDWTETFREVQSCLRTKLAATPEWSPVVAPEGNSLPISNVMLNFMSALPPAPLVVTGMHRSGLSLTASFLSALGIRFSDRSAPSDPTNLPRNLEDTDFAQLQKRMLDAATLIGDRGHPDWGWTESESLAPAGFAADAPAARALVSARSAHGGMWGWTDPRTTLLLDFWDELLAGRALYVLVYRFPWEVADSMQRSGGPVFLENPDYALRIWTFYNRRLLDFYRRHSDRAILVSSNALQRSPETFVDLLGSKLGVPVAETSFDDVWQKDLFTSFGRDDPLAWLTAATSPKCSHLLAEMDADADLPATGLWNASGPGGERLRPSGAVDLSVIIPCYNQGQFLVDAVASVERTASERCEVLIVNDGSTQPRTLEVLDSLRQAGYRIIDQPNAGLAAARNRGIRAARGRYILPLDSDNRLALGYVEAAVAVLDAKPEVGVVYGDRLDFGLRSGRAKVPEFDLTRLLWWNFIDACAVYRREIWEACGGYDAAANPLEDWEFWIAAAKRDWHFHRLPHVTLEYRVRPDSMLARADFAVLSSIWKYVRRKHRALYEEHLSDVLIAGHTQLLEAWDETASLKKAMSASPGGRESPAQAGRNHSPSKTSLDALKRKEFVRVTAFLATHDIPEDSMPWMEEVRNIFDELVIFIDEKRVTPGTVARAEKVGSRVRYHKAETWYEWDLASMARACGSDWVFQIERDEQLSPEWQQNAWRQILETTHVTHLWVPRRWVVPGGKYITADPWAADFQLRLLRNNIPGTTFPTRLHDTTYVPGPGGRLRNLAINHHVLWQVPRAAREERVRYYEQLRPGYALGHYYLYEDFAPAEAPLPKPVKLDADQEIIWSEKLPAEKISRISLEVSGVPPDVQVSARFRLEAQITNANDKPLWPGTPYPVRLAYHWLERNTRQVAVFEGNRSELFPGLEANAAGKFQMTIAAPDRPGAYILQTTIVQEGVCWFEDVRPDIMQEFAVSVMAGGRRPEPSAGGYDSPDALMTAHATTALDHLRGAPAEKRHPDKR
jgi:glycosyl transferase family 2